MSLFTISCVVSAEKGSTDKNDFQWYFCNKAPSKADDLISLSSSSSGKRRSSAIVAQIKKRRYYGRIASERVKVWCRRRDGVIPRRYRISRVMIVRSSIEFRVTETREERESARERERKREGGEKREGKEEKWKRRLAATRERALSSSRREAARIPGTAGISVSNVGTANLSSPSPSPFPSTRLARSRPDAQDVKKRGCVPCRCRNSVGERVSMRKRFAEGGEVFFLREVRRSGIEEYEGRE